jgi:sterol 24-C-methyltransferase
MLKQAAGGVEKDKVQQTTDKYNDLFDHGTAEDRKENYTGMVNNYYDLITDFFEYGWGLSFHFAPRRQGESFAASIARHEHWLAHKLGLKEGQKVLDVGCGVGGPLIEIARFTGANVTGINNNSYQISRGLKNIELHGLHETCTMVKGDFMKMPFADASFDAIFSIEATCHAPSKVALYSEILRLLKPGAYFASYEWLMTPLYDPSNPHHNEIKHLVEIGDALPNLDSFEVCLKAYRDAGFEVIESKDLAPIDTRNNVPWYKPFEPTLNPTEFKSSPAGIAVTRYLIRALEKVGIMPKGAVHSHEILEKASRGLLDGGRTGIFTPMFFVLVRKPLDK